VNISLTSLISLLPMWPSFLFIKSELVGYSMGYPGMILLAMTSLLAITIFAYLMRAFAISLT